MSEMKNTPNQDSLESEIAIKFGKGLAQPFTGKDGTQYMRIQIPNRDPQDKSPWQSFVVPAKAVHENHYGKGLWMKLPLHGSTTVSRDVRTGYRAEGNGRILQDPGTGPCDRCTWRTEAGSCCSQQAEAAPQLQHGAVIRFICMGCSLANRKEV